MKSVLIVIRTQWVNKIVSGKKTIEVRKSAPKEVPFKAYIYCCKAKSQWSLCDYEGAYANSQGEIVYAQQHIIGEFICDRIDEYKYVYCDHPEIGYPVGYDCGDNWYDIDDEDLQKACLTEEEFKRYGNGKPLYGWHISDLKIYDKPKELSEFYRICKNPCKPSNGGILCLTTKTLKMNGCDGKIPLTRPPQSWQYVEEVKQ